MKSFVLPLAILLSALGVLLLWTSVLRVSRIDAVADPSVMHVGDESTVRVRLLNSFGFTTPFATRTPEFSIDSGATEATLVRTDDPLVVRVRAQHVGTIELQIRVEGSLFPLHVEIRVEPMLARTSRYRNDDSKVVLASVRPSRYLTMIGDETDSP